jgi:transposase
LNERVKRKLLDYFVLGVPAYELRFRNPASRAGTERIFHLVRQVISLAEEITAPFAGAIVCDETCFGGYLAGIWG